MGPRDGLATSPLFCLGFREDLAERSSVTPRVAGDICVPPASKTYSTSTSEAGDGGLLSGETRSATTPRHRAATRHNADR